MTEQTTPAVERRDDAPEPQTLIEQYRYALAWCSAADDFAPGDEFSPPGNAREGWLKIVKPLLDQEAR
jgi:hypothetical protein